MTQASGCQERHLAGRKHAAVWQPSIDKEANANLSGKKPSKHTNRT